MWIESTPDHRVHVVTAGSALADELHRAVAASAEVFAVDVLAAGECTAVCLLAREPNGCGCRCTRVWHGTLSGVRVSANADERPAAAVIQ